MNIKDIIYDLKEIWTKNLLSCENAKDLHYCKGALFIITLIIEFLPLLDNN